MVSGGKKEHKRNYLPAYRLLTLNTFYLKNPMSKKSCQQSKRCRKQTKANVPAQLFYLVL